MRHLLLPRFLWLTILCGLLRISNHADALTIIFPTSEIVDAEFHCSDPATALMTLSKKIDAHMPFITRVNYQDLGDVKFPDKKFSFKSVTFGAAIQNICDAYDAEFSINEEGVVTLLKKTTLQKFTRFYNLDANFRELWVEATRKSFERFGCDLTIDKYQGTEEVPQGVTDP
jgi:hypothetical protein